MRCLFRERDWVALQRTILYLAMQAVPLRAEASEASLEGGLEGRAAGQQGEHQHDRLVGGRK